jgi:hypothetical protein
LFAWRRDSDLLRHQRLFHLTQELQHYITTINDSYEAERSLCSRPVGQEISCFLLHPLFMDVIIRTGMKTKKKVT